MPNQVRQAGPRQATAVATAMAPAAPVTVSLTFDPNLPQVRLKRLLDVTLSLAAIVVLAPLFLLIAVATKLASPGPVFFVQQRVAAGGRLFPLLKFRTMVPNAEALKSSMDALNECDGPVFKIRRDPRVTAVGRFLRRYSLDELPQLFNIVLGDMSLVGPRPPVPEEVRSYQPHVLRRLSVPQGLTCIWQVSGRSDVSFEQWMTMDLAYIDSWTLSLDLKLIARTFVAVLLGRGAY